MTKLRICAGSILCLFLVSACATQPATTGSSPQQQQTLISPAVPLPTVPPPEEPIPTPSAPSVSTPQVSVSQPDVVPAPQTSESAPRPQAAQPKDLTTPNPAKDAAPQPAEPVLQPTEEPSLPPDSPVFEDEDLINMEGRMLNPYSYLTPDAAARGNAPWDGEQLKYGIYYTFIRAGTAYIRNRGLVDIDGKPAYWIQTSAFSASVIDAFFKVRDINHSWIDAQTFYSRGYGQSVREGGYKRDEWVIFAPEENRYYGKIQKKEEPRDIGAELTGPVADFLSSLYFVRAQKLEVGKDIVFDIVNREKQYPLLVKVLRKEKIKTPAGSFNCIVVEPQLRGEGIFVSKGKSLTVWLTDDEYHMPVKMKVEVFIGSVSASLLEYKRL